jgi:hypothetical protein
MALYLSPFFWQGLYLVFRDREQSVNKFLYFSFFESVDIFIPFCYYMFFGKINRKCMPRILPKLPKIPKTNQKKTLCRY